MKKNILILLLPILALACSKMNPGGLTTTTGPSLWPLKAGYSWIYQDSVFSDTALTSTYLDTATITTQTETDPSSGTVYYGISEYNGWFGTGGYVAVDPYNTTIDEWDSLNYPYIFFQTGQYDGQFIGSGNDFSNPTCVKQSVQYGFATPTNINGYNCLKNIEYTVDCNNITTEVVVTYVCPGVGVVRMEDYMADSTRNYVPFMDYSQTLRTANQ